MPVKELKKVWLWQCKIKKMKNSLEHGKFLFCKGATYKLAYKSLHYT